MTNRDRLLRGCDLHVHMKGAFYPEDVWELGRPVYQDVDWEMLGYLTDYERVFGVKPDPKGAFARAIEKPGDISLIREYHVFTEKDGGDFTRWEVKTKFFDTFWRYYSFNIPGETGDRALLHLMLRSQGAHGLDYVEFRNGCGVQYLHYWLGLCAEYFKEVSNSGLTAKHILSFPRGEQAAWEHYDALQKVFDARPDIIDTLVGIDFAGAEEGYPPKMLRGFVKHVLAQNRLRPDRAVDVVYHVGESFFDKSLESAVRWCHEVAEMGVVRIGHGIALGLDPEVALSRRDNAHETESAAERIDQIDYDLLHAHRLRQYRVMVNEDQLNAEKEKLQYVDPAHPVRIEYTTERIDEIRRRQKFAMDRFKELGTVIECCPSSNIRIGGIPREDHPIKCFLENGLRVVICSDDPGKFDIDVSQEVDLVMQLTGMSEDDLIGRLGDPRQFRLAAHRVKPGSP
ncbi:MAG: hypothetical protein HY694_16535 [Deltaproteobacteria bacterium]|nr:hypothetical protein [Deltaproteobacteria bacterium]